MLGRYLVDVVTLLESCTDPEQGQEVLMRIELGCGW